MSNASKYDTDFYAWAIGQATLLREGRFAEVDIANIAEELDSMGRSEKRELISRLAVLLTHLLKWKFQPGHRGASWQLTDARTAGALGKPSERQSKPPALAGGGRRRCLAFGLDRGRTGNRLGRIHLPLACPWTPDQVLSDGFLPDT